jgi:hypothetical protein
MAGVSEMSVRLLPSSTWSSVRSERAPARVTNATRVPSGDHRAGDLYAADRVSARGCEPSRSLSQSSYWPERVD